MLVSCSPVERVVPETKYLGSVRTRIWSDLFGLRTSACWTGGEMVSFSSSAKRWYSFYSFISRGLACLYICTVYTEREVIYSTDSVLQIVVQDKNTSQMDFPDNLPFRFPRRQQSCWTQERMQRQSTNLTVVACIRNNNDNDDDDSSQEVKYRK